jgi:hypothetical protein
MMRFEKVCIPFGLGCHHANQHVLPHLDESGKHVILDSSTSTHETRYDDDPERKVLLGDSSGKTNLRSMDLPYGDRSLPPEAIAALKSFDETCCALGNPTFMDLPSFRKLLGSFKIGTAQNHNDRYTAQQVEALFINLHNQICAEISVSDDEALGDVTHTKKGEKIVTRSGLAALYASPAYVGLHQPESRRTATSELFEELDKLEESRNSRMNPDARRLQRTLSATLGNIPSRFDTDLTELPKHLVKLSNPRSASAEEFVSALENWVLSHPAIHHTFYKGLASGAFGDVVRSKAMLVRFLEGYSNFSRNFSSYVSSLLDFFGGADELLSENLREESGIYDDEMLSELREQGFDVNNIIGIPHKDLQSRVFQKIKYAPGVEVELEKVGDISHLGLMLKHLFDHLSTESLASSLGSLYFGCELIVPLFYRKILDAIDTLFGDYLTKDDKLFYDLHIGLDQDHAMKLKEKILTCIASNDSVSYRMELLQSAFKVMEARHQFVCQAVAELTSTQGPVQATNKLYNTQSSNWKRTEKKCLSDFTGRPHIFEMCEGLGLRDKWVLGKT